MQRDEHTADGEKAAQQDQAPSEQQEHKAMIEAQKTAAKERKREGGYQ